MSNYPDNVSASDPEAPWNQTREPVQDEDFINIALDELEMLKDSLVYLDRRNTPKKRFDNDCEVLKHLETTLRDMLGEEG